LHNSYVNATYSPCKSTQETISQSFGSIATHAKLTFTPRVDNPISEHQPAIRTYLSSPRTG
jgi:hypothetical protein